MQWPIPPSALSGLLADAGPGPLIYPLAGSLAIAAVFLSAAIITGGLWLVKRSNKHTAPYFRRIFWFSLGGAALFGTAVPGVIGLFLPPVLIVAVAMFGAGVYAIVLGFQSPTSPQIENPADQEGSAAKVPSIVPDNSIREKF